MEDWTFTTTSNPGTWLFYNYETGKIEPYDGPQTTTGSQSTDKEARPKQNK